MMRTRQEVMSRKENLDWEIRFGPKHGVLEDKIREMEDERRGLVERRKEIESKKDHTQ